MITTGQTSQIFLPAAGKSSSEWHTMQNEPQNSWHSTAQLTPLDNRPDEAAGEAAETEPSRPQAEPANETGDDDDLLIIPLRPAERRAEDFLPGWVRRFSRA